MKIKKLTTSFGAEGLTTVGQELEVGENRGKELIARGLAEAASEKKPAKKAKAEKESESEDKKED